MVDLVPNRFPPLVAYDTNTGQTIRNAIADVYAVDDTSFTTPLELVDLAGVPMANLVSSNDGVYPPFVIDSETEYAEVVAKSESFITPMVSFVGGRGPQGDAGPAGTGIPDTTDATAGMAVVWDGTAAVWQTVTGTGGTPAWDDVQDKPATYPSDPHTTALSDLRNGSAPLASQIQALLAAGTPQAARAAIGAGTGNGTSDLVLGSTGTTAMPGNRAFGSTEISRAAGGGLTSTTVEGALIELKSSIGTGGGTSSVLVVKYASGAYPALPSSKPSGVEKIEFLGPVQPTSGNVSGGIPAYVGLGATQIPGFFTVAALS